MSCWSFWWLKIFSLQSKVKFSFSNYATLNYSSTLHSSHFFLFFLAVSFQSSWYLNNNFELSFVSVQVMQVYDTASIRVKSSVNHSFSSQERYLPNVLSYLTFDSHVIRSCHFKPKWTWEPTDVNIITRRNKSYYYMPTLSLNKTNAVNGWFLVTARDQI